MIPSCTVAYGATTITYDLVFSRRKTLGIIVYPDSQVTVRAPIGTSLAEIDRIVQKKAAWIVRKQRQFESYPPPSPPRQYLSGESHRYLGKQYRLKVIEDLSGPESVKLTRGRFLVHVRAKSDTARVKRLLTEWYRRQARRVFAERLAASYPKVQRYGIPYPGIKIRLMQKRWGSCSPKGHINLNLKLVQVPKPYIDYVILHELCHFVEPNHSRAYYDLLGCVLPDWRDQRAALHQIELT